MIQLITFIYLTGLVSFTEAIFDKFNFWEKIQRLGANSDSEFIYKLTSCMFCIRFHLTWIIYFVFFAVNTDFVNGWFLIFSVTGILTLINKNK